MRKSPYLPALTSLRGIAAGWVVLYHFQDVLHAAAGTQPAWLWRIVSHGHFAVDLFFLLSGYIIAHNYLDSLQPSSPRDCLRFWYMRLARIYPAHLVGLLAVVPMVGVARHLGLGLSDEGYGVKTFFQHLTLTQAWVPFMKLSWNYPAWSVSAEWAAYLLFPLLVVPLRRVHGKAANGLLLASGALALGLMGRWLTPEVPFRELFRVTVAFSVGAALLHASRTLRPAPGLPRVAALASFAGLGLALGRQGTPSSVFLLLFAALVWSLAELRPGDLQALCARPMLWLGEISYSLYISHALTQKVLNEVFPAHRLQGLALPGRVLGLGLYAALLLAGAYALWRGVEVPARSGMKNLLERPRPSGVPERVG